MAVRKPSNTDTQRCEVTKQISPLPYYMEVIKMEVLRVYNQNGFKEGYYLVEEENMCKMYCETHAGYSYKKEKLFYKILDKKRFI